MKKIYQKIINNPNKKGDCMQAVVASLFNRKLDDIPKFIEMNDEESNDKWFTGVCDYVKTQGYNVEDVLYNKNYLRLLKPTNNCFNKEKWNSTTITKKCLYKHSGIDEFYFAFVFSPKSFSWENQKYHAVIIDKNFNIIHDPSPTCENILEYPLKNVLGYNGITYVILINKII